MWKKAVALLGCGAITLILGSLNFSHIFIANNGLFQGIQRDLAVNRSDSPCEKTQDNPSSFKESEKKFILSPGSFWELDQVPGVKKHLDSIIAKSATEGVIIPAPLPFSQLSSRQRAELLQWSLILANRLIQLNPLFEKVKVQIQLPVCEYDFTSVKPLDRIKEPFLNSAETNFWPQLFIKEDGISLVGTASKDKPVLTYQGRPQVLILTRDRAEFEISGLRFHGSHESSKLFDIENYRHVNPNLGGAAASWATVMIGYQPKMIKDLASPEKRTLSNCEFENINFRAIATVDDLTLIQNKFTGIVLDPTEPNPSGNYNLKFSCFSNWDAAKCSNLGLPDLTQKDIHSLSSGIGMNWLTAVYLRGSIDRSTQPPTPVSATIRVQNNSFVGWVEGLILDNLNSSEIKNNTFSTIVDHAIYLLGTMSGSSISSNLFQKTLSPALKIGGNNLRTDQIPDRGSEKSQILSNRFRLNHNTPILISGSQNTISGNTFEPSINNSAEDPLGWYQPIWKSQSGKDARTPRIWLTAFGLNQGYCNSANENRLVNNSMNLTSDPNADRTLDIFIESEVPNCPAQSASGNRISISPALGQQTVSKIYFLPRANSNDTVYKSGPISLCTGKYLSCP